MTMVVGRRSALAGLAAAVLERPLRAQEAVPVPLAVPAPAPPPVAPPTPGQPRPAAPLVTAIAADKHYYLFFEQVIDTNSMRTLRRQLSTLMDAGVMHVTLVINSPGGQVDATLAAYGLIRALPITVDTHALGFVQSAATVLFLAGQQRSCDRTARFLFHPASAPVLGTFTGQQLGERLSQFDAVAEVLMTIYRDRTKLTEDQVRRFAGEQVIYTAEQAQETGVVTTVADLRIPGGNTARMLFLE